MNGLRTLSLLGINLALVTVACGGGEDPIDPDPTGSGTGGAAASTSSGNSTSSGMGGDPSTTTTGSTMVTSTSSSTGGMGTGGMGTGGMGTGGMVPVDTTPPTIVSVSPTNGATGVANNEVIVVTFSEPMDKPSAQAAFQSANLGAVTFNWLDDMTMEVTPTGLAYAQGGPTVMANVYDFTVTTVATDLAGNPMAQNAPSSFSTLRDVTDYMPETLETTIEANGTSCETQFVMPVGKWIINTNQKDCRLLLGFDLSSIPANALVNGSSLSCGYQNVFGPTPSGQTKLHHINFDPNNLAAGWSAAPVQTYNNPFSFGTLNPQSSFTENTTAAIINELSGQSPTSIHFRLNVVAQTIGATNNYLNWQDPQNPTAGCGNQALEVSYLAP